MFSLLGQKGMSLFRVGEGYLLELVDQALGHGDVLVVLGLRAKRFYHIDNKNKIKNSAKDNCELI